MKFLMSALATAMLFVSFSAHAQFNDFGRGGRGGPGYDRGHDRGGWDRGGGGYPGRGGPGPGSSFDCQQATNKVYYCQGEVQKYAQLIQNADRLCGANPVCRLQQQQAYQYTVNELQKAQNEQAAACR